MKHLPNRLCFPGFSLKIPHCLCWLFVSPLLQTSAKSYLDKMLEDWTGHHQHQQDFKRAAEVADTISDEGRDNVRRGREEQQEIMESSIYHSREKGYTGFNYSHFWIFVGFKHNFHPLSTYPTPTVTHFYSWTLVFSLVFMRGEKKNPLKTYCLRKLSPKLVDTNTTSQNDCGLPSSGCRLHTSKRLPAHLACLLLFELVTLLSQILCSLYIDLSASTAH